ncbi:ComEC/Rec2 family competence protein [Alkaliphilus hydrothermalis]|uniref:Competence protein ComEC n=1 Tax=Alkaliphilus hydrothermalis TaxID=1482730 RepID=A0ABS2NS39_9FIRM|nr:ComEC/Rec2 family competence protein [Alkaliphilus hydrothermalis]MBM7615784.1 competence protein ComEC [Alkaliphilus hydrothermalis]
MKISKGKLLFIFLISLIVLVVGFPLIMSPQPLAIHVLDVGQGDSILIITPNNKSILIDGGDEDYGEYVVDYLKRQNIKRIDWLVGTHPHSDHIGGLGTVISHLEIGEFYMPSTPHTSIVFEDLLRNVAEKKLKITGGKAGDVIDISKDLSINLLGPLENYGDDLNNWSIVLQLKYKEKSFIFMGDAEEQVEEDLLDAYPSHQLKSHFIKIGHHGSTTSTSPKFLDALAPDVAIITVGKDNAYGHPHKSILQRIYSYQVKLYRTDLQGSVVFYSDGQKIWSTTPPLRSK